MASRIGAAVREKEELEVSVKKFIIAASICFLLLQVSAAYATDYTGTLSLSLSEGYNDNIYLTHENRTSDFITYISPGIEFTAKSLTTELKLDYMPTFSLYSSHSDLNDTGQNLSANASFSFSGALNLIVSENFVKSSTIQDIVAIPNVGPVTALSEITINNLSATLSYKLRDNLTYAVGASYYISNNSLPYISDMTDYSGNMGLTYMPDERTSLSINANYTKYDYTLTSDASGLNCYLGATYKLTPTITIGLTGGATWTKIDDTGDTSTNFSGGIDIKKSFEKGDLHLYYSQAVNPGIDSGVPLLQQSVGISLAKPLTAQWNTSVSASYNLYKSVGQSSEDYAQTVLGAGVSYNLTPWANLGLSYNFVKSHDKLNDSNDYYNNIVLLALKINYSRKF